MSKRAKEKGGRRRRKSLSFLVISFYLFHAFSMSSDCWRGLSSRNIKSRMENWRFLMENSKTKARRSCFPHSHHHSLSFSLEIETLAPMNLFFNFRVPFLLADSGFLCTRSTRDGWNCLFQKLSCFFSLSTFCELMWVICDGISTSGKVWGFFRIFLNV